VATALTSPEYVYLFLVVVTPDTPYPIAKIPAQEFPAARPKPETTLDVVATALVSLEYVYLFLIFEELQVGDLPSAKIPTVELPAAAPACEFALEAVADPLISPEYVYLLRVVDAPQLKYPNANIPNAAVPVADWFLDAQEAQVADVFTSPEKVYLSRVVDLLVPHAFVAPKANIATVPKAFPATGHTPAFCHPTIWSMVHTPEAAPHWNGPAGVTGVLVISPP
jgi:hypothetical protein